MKTFLLIGEDRCVDQDMGEPSLVSENQALREIYNPFISTGKYRYLPEESKKTNDRIPRYMLGKQSYSMR